MKSNYRFEYKKAFCLLCLLLSVCSCSSEYEDKVRVEENRLSAMTKEERKAEQEKEYERKQSEFSDYLYKVLVASFLGDNNSQCYGLKNLVTNNKTPEIFFVVYEKPNPTCQTKSTIDDLLVVVNGNGVAELFSEEGRRKELPIRMNIGTHHEAMREIIKSMENAWFVISKDGQCITEGSPAEYYETLQKFGGANEIYDNHDGSVEVRTYSGNGMYEFAKFFKGKERCQNDLYRKQKNLDQYR